MSTTLVTRVAASLTPTTHPFGQILVVLPQADVTDPVSAAAALATGAELIAGSQDFAAQVQGGGTAGLTAAGVAAIAGAYNTYVSGLSATKKSQVGFLRAVVTSTGMACSVHIADVATFAATLQTVLNNASNFGVIGQ